MLTTQDQQIIREVAAYLNSRLESQAYGKILLSVLEQRHNLNIPLESNAQHRINFKFLRGLVNVFQYETEPVTLTDANMEALFQVETLLNTLPMVRVHIETPIARAPNITQPREGNDD